MTNGGKGKRTSSKGRPTAGRAARRRAQMRATARRRRRAWIAVSLGAAVLAGVIALAFGADNDGGSGVTDASAFDLPALGSDGRVRLTDFRGRPTVVNFFASWCTQCDAELPEFRDAARALDGRVNFIFVNSNESGNWRPMAQRHQLVGNFPLARDVAGTSGNGLYRSIGGTGGMPITAFYDADGRLVDRSFGALVGGSLPSKITDLYSIDVPTT